MSGTSTRDETICCVFIFTSNLGSLSPFQELSLWLSSKRPKCPNDQQALGDQFHFVCGYFINSSYGFTGHFVMLILIIFVVCCIAVIWTRRQRQCVAVGPKPFSVTHNPDFTPFFRATTFREGERADAELVQSLSKLTHIPTKLAEFDTATKFQRCVCCRTFVDRQISFVESHARHCFVMREAFGKQQQREEPIIAAVQARGYWPALEQVEI